MFLLTVKDNKDDGAYAVQDKYGHKVLFLFQEEDDATRYSLMLEDEEGTYMDVVEVDDDLAIKTCKLPAVYQESAIPRSYVVSRDGRLIMEHTGLADYDSRKFREFLTKALEERSEI